MLIDGTIPRSTTSVAEVTTNAAFEKRLAPFTGKHSIVLARWLVTANCTFNLLYIFLRWLLYRFGLFRAPCWNWNHGHSTGQISTTDIIINPTVSVAASRGDSASGAVLPWLINRSEARDHCTRKQLMDLQRRECSRSLTRLKIRCATAFFTQVSGICRYVAAERRYTRATITCKQYLAM